VVTERVLFDAAGAVEYGVLSAKKPLNRKLISTTCSELLGVDINVKADFNCIPRILDSVI
jgi:hypothetical protein